MKNPHGVEPTRFLKRKGSNKALYCAPQDGIAYGNDDIHIHNNCHRKNSCSIHNDGKGGYECHPEYKSSLFVNTAGPDEENYFTVLDYEVFDIDNYNDYFNNIFEHPDIIREYYKTKNIPEESMKQVDDEEELSDDSDAIPWDLGNIRVKLPKFFFTYSNELLPNSQLVNQEYDSYLREWLGNDYQWKLLYRASEHGYTGRSFHEYCNDKGPTLVVIKSSEGWIFGGYTTQSWNGGGIYIDMI